MWANVALNVIRVWASRQFPLRVDFPAQIL
jgi:hypothetical protein